MTPVATEPVVLLGAAGPSTAGPAGTNQQTATSVTAAAVGNHSPAQPAPTSTPAPASSVSASSSLGGATGTRAAPDGRVGDAFTIDQLTRGSVTHHASGTPPRDPYREIPTSPA